MASRILLIRHGRTAGNGRHYVGREDLPLDPVGVAQAQQVAAELADEPIAAVYTSALTRSVQTATPLVADRPMPLYVRPDLNEIDYGAYQGLSKVGKPFSLKRDFRDRRMPGGESLRDVFTRVRRFAGELHSRQDETVAVVGHYRSNQMLLAVLTGLTFEDALDLDYSPANGSIHEITVAGSPRRRWILTS